ncbi:MAG: hypothetical protein OEW12_06220 [Deltaproteobacteria bacterium]|nr:hypothetical protein [Deltaproteobacteria bacterium]
MKRLFSRSMVGCLALWLVAGQPLEAQAQEKPPLAMGITFQWTAAGGVLGAVVGVAMWMTDPGNPANRLGRSVMEGTAWGVFAGAAMGGMMMARNARGTGQPTADLWDPLAPENRIGGREIAEAQTRYQLAAAYGGPEIIVPVLDIRF